MPSPDTEVPSFKLCMFGPMAVEVDGNPLRRLATRKRLWLLALLALRNNREVDRSWLAGTLWPDSSETQALANLRQSLTELRGALGKQAYRLISSPRFVHLDLSAAFCDVLSFDAAVARGDPPSLGEALALYRGPLLEGCSEAWIVSDREFREQAFLRALSAVAARASDTGDLWESCRLLRLGIAVAPLEETMHRLLMEALLKQGETAAATEVYRELRILLHRELNASPSAETTAVYHRIRLHPPARAVTGALKRELPGNVPRPRTALIGREQEVGKIAALLLGDEPGPGAAASTAARRLITLTGTGGVGKTRLAIRLAESLSSYFADGVWFVDLSPLVGPALVPHTVASVLDVRERADRSISAELADHLKSKSVLLILDNCEHVVDGCSRLVDTLIERCPGLRLLATSRQPLGVPGELTWRVPSLELPTESRAATARPAADERDDPLRYASVRLFVERVLDHEPRFVLHRDNRVAVEQICRRLDGIPLAIELAAARTRVLSVEQIAERLLDRFRLLTGGSRTAPTRQQTLRAAIDWSYNLLTEPEQLLFRRLSVFAGGWSLEAAEAVCDGSQDTLEVLDQLVEKSLVTAETHETRARYRMLESVRQYAGEKLEQVGRTPATRRLHAEYYLMLAEKIAPQLGGEEQAILLEELEREHDNMRESLAWLQESPQGGEAGLRLCAALWRFWDERGHWSEGRARLAAALGHPDAQERTKAKSDALNGAGNLACSESDYAAARTLHEMALCIRREISDLRGVAGSLNNLGLISCWQGDSEAAQTFYAEALALNRHLGNKAWEAANLIGLGVAAAFVGDDASARQYYEECLLLHRSMGNVLGMGNALTSLGIVVQRSGDLPAARRIFEEALELFGTLKSGGGRVQALVNLGNLARAEGQYVEARDVLRDCLRLSQDLGDRRVAAFGLEGIAELARLLGRPQSAARLYGASAALREAIGSPYPKFGRPEYDAAMGGLRSVLGITAFEREMAAGRAMQWREAIHAALDVDLGIDAEIQPNDGELQDAA